MRYNPQLKEERYYKQQEKYPKELYFPQYFNIKLDKVSFQQGKQWGQNDENRFAIAIHKNIPKKFDLQTFKDKTRIQASVFTQVFSNNDQTVKTESSNIQFGTYNKELDLEYYFHFSAIDKQTQDKIFRFERTGNWHPRSFGQNPLRFKIQYATRYTNSAGSYWQLYGYIYIPNRRSK